MLRKLFSGVLGRSRAPTAAEFGEWTPIAGVAPEGDWVQWKVGSRFQVEPGIPDEEYRRLALRLARAEAPWARIRRDGDRLEVTLGTGPEDAGQVAGHAVGEVARYERELAADMPRAAQPKGVIGDGREIRILVSGLMPPAKVRVAQGWEKPQPRNVTLSEDDLAAFEALMARLDAEPSIAGDEAMRRATVARDARHAAIANGEPIDEVGSGLDHFRKPETEMRAYMREAANDLSEQCRIVERMLDAWFDRGLQPAPYYPRRIGIILRKAKRKDLDARFTAAWDRHFPV